MKTLIRFVFAAIIAAGAYSYSIGSEKAVKMMDPDPDATYEIIDQTHPDYGGSENEFNYSEAEQVCPGDGTPCADLVEGGNSENPTSLEWQGFLNKF